MSDRLKALMPLIAALSEEERDELREQLDEPELNDEEWEAAWMEEVERREAELAKGTSRLIPWEEIQAKWKARRA